MYVKLKPLGEQVLLKKRKAEECSAGGVLLTASVKENTDTYEVIAVGQGNSTDDSQNTMSVEAGQTVVVDEYLGQAVKFEGEEYLMVKKSNIIAAVEYWG